MELKLFLKLIQKNTRIILFAGLIGLVLGAVVATQLGDSYVATHSVYVQKVPEKPESGDFTYDGYYAQQAAELYTDTVVGLFESPAIAARALEIADQGSSAEDVEQFQRRVDVEKMAPRLINVQVKSKSPQESSTLASALFQSVSERVDTFTSQDNETFNMDIDVVTAEPLLAMEEPIILLFAVVGLLLGLFISTSGVMLREYLLSA